jgi:hypothetical protein
VPKKDFAWMTASGAKRSFSFSRMVEKGQKASFSVDYFYYTALTVAAL